MINLNVVKLRIRSTNYTHKFAGCVRVCLLKVLLPKVGAVIKIMHAVATTAR